jgi:hypothetical protein
VLPQCGHFARIAIAGEDEVCDTKKITINNLNNFSRITIVNLTRERDEARAERDRLRNYVGSNDLRSDYQTADQMRAAIDTLRQQLADERKIHLKTLTALNVMTEAMSELPVYLEYIGEQRTRLKGQVGVSQDVVEEAIKETES